MKDSAKPSGPFRPAQSSPNAMREELVEAKRAELWAGIAKEGKDHNVAASATAVKDPGKHFQLNYDDEDLQDNQQHFQEGIMD